MDPHDQLRTAIAQAQRRMAVCEARYHGLVRALVSDQPIVWYAKDAELQREFEAGFDAGRGLLASGESQGASGRIRM